MTDRDFMRNDLNMRPDFNSMRIMGDVPVKEQKVFEMLNDNTYFGKKLNDKDYSIWKRFIHFFYPYTYYKPSEADYEPFFDYKKDYVTEEFKNHYHFKI